MICGYEVWGIVTMKGDSMVIRVLMLLLSFMVVTNLILVLVGILFKVNMYKKYGRAIVIFYSGFFLFIIAVFIVFAMLGLL